MTRHYNGTIEVADQIDIDFTTLHTEEYGPLVLHSNGELQLSRSNVMFDVPTSGSDAGNLVIKDGVLPKYTETTTPGQPITVSCSLQYQGQTVPEHYWSNCIYYEVTPSETLDLSSLNTLDIDYVTNGIHYTGTITKGQPAYVDCTYDFYGDLEDENGNTLSYPSASGPEGKAPVFEDYGGTLYLYVPNTIDTLGGLTTSLSIITGYTPGTSEQYVDLGSQLGTGWVQDREYTVKFKNGKLYLS